MKKKGLIISTVVMAVVLIASLTTATYAWFSADASATIDGMNLMTKASEGLQIATYRYSGGSYNYKHGTMTTVNIAGTTDDSQGKYWMADEDDFGDSISFASGDAPQIDNLFGASGNGVTLYKNAQDSTLVGGKPVTMITALPNNNYMVLDFAIQSTAASIGKLFVNELKITPSGEKSAMCGSLRIALFSNTDFGTGTPTTPYPEYSISDGVFLYDPYAGYKYANGTFTTGNDITELEFAEAEGTYAEAMTGVDLSDESNWGSKYVEGNGSISGTTASSINLPFEDSIEAVTTSNGGNPNYVLGTINPAGIIYLRLVIWYDGEDGANRQAFAGGGADITLNFGLDLTNVD